MAHIPFLTFSFSFLRHIPPKLKLYIPEGITLLNCQCKVFWPSIAIMTVHYHHITYAFQSESTLYSCLNVKELLAQNRCDIWSLSDSNEIQTYYHLVCKQTLNHLVKLVKWLSVCLQTKWLLFAWMLLLSLTVAVYLINKNCSYRNNCGILLYDADLEHSLIFTFKFNFRNLKDANSCMFLWCITTSSLTIFPCMIRL